MAESRDFFPTEVAIVNDLLRERPLLDTAVTGLVDEAREMLGLASWFAPGSRLMFESVLLYGQATLGDSRVAAAAAGQTVQVTLADAVVPVRRPDRSYVRSLPEWIEGWCAALVARDQPSIDGLRGVPDDLHRQSRSQFDAYHYAFKDALVSVTTDRDRCLAAVGEARGLWKKRTIAMKWAADVDAALIDGVESLANAQPGPFNDALYRALVAHAEYWSTGDNELAARGWVALTHLALACVAHDRGMPVEVESDYLPRALVEQRFSPEPSLASPPPPSGSSRPEEEDAAEQVRQLTREMGFVAGEGFARLRLEPEGYRRVPLERDTVPGFDFVYAKDGGEVSLIDTLAGDLQRDPIEGSDGGLFEPGTRSWIELALEEIRETAPDVAQQIQLALESRKLRYFEVYQPIDQDGRPTAIRVREYVLSPLRDY